MKTHIELYEPAMCCPTGLCSVGGDSELLRISTLIHDFQKRGITIERYNLTSNPMRFMTNSVVNYALNEMGIDGLPFTVVDGKIEIKGRYPTNEEFDQIVSSQEK